jgi:hypothetical protein
MDTIHYPFGAPDVQALNGALASNAVDVSNRKTILTITPGVDTAIALTADSQLPVGSEVDVLITAGATAYDVAFTGVNAKTITAEQQAASGWATVTLMYDGTTFWQKSVAASA